MKLVIQNGVVIGTATDDYEAGPFDDDAIAAPAGFDAINDLSRYGWTAEGGLQPVTPKSVTMRQARLALLGAGLLDAVDAAIAGAGAAAKIEWDYATEVQRSAGLVPQMATALGMTTEQIDALFIAAAAL